MDYTKDIKRLLGEAAAFCPEIDYREEVDSTNEWIKRLAMKGAPEGTTVCADAQTAGKGRSGRVWVSPAGENIYFSILLRPSFPPRQAAGLTLVMGLSVTEALGEMGLPVRIKWPNDVVAGGKKVCGILTELTVLPGGACFVVVGTGINVGQTVFSEAISRRATSVRLALEEMKTAAAEGTGLGKQRTIAIPEGASAAAGRDWPESMRCPERSLTERAAEGIQPDCGPEGTESALSRGPLPDPAALLDRGRILAAVLKRFAENYEKYTRTGDLTHLLDAYNALLVNRGRRVRIEDPKGPYLALAKGIDVSGALLVEREDGTLEAVSSGEVSVRGIYGYV